MVLTLLSFPFLVGFKVSFSLLDQGLRQMCVCYLIHQPAHVRHSIGEVYALQAVWNTFASRAPRMVLDSWVMS